MEFRGLKVVEQNGYPAINAPWHELAISNGRVYIHRLVYWEANGNIPDKMHIHHKDDDRWNWSLDNLELLSPEEHASLHKSGEVEVRICSICGKRVPVTSARRKNRENVLCGTRCRDKHSKKPKIDWPSREEVVSLVNGTSYSEAGRRLGVSDNAVRKFLKRTGN